MRTIIYPITRDQKEILEYLVRTTFEENPGTTLTVSKEGMRIEIFRTWDYIQNDVIYHARVLTHYEKPFWTKWIGASSPNPREIVEFVMRLEPSTKAPSTPVERHRKIVTKKVRVCSPEELR